MSQELKDTMEKIGRAFEAFKAANDERLAEIEKKGTADPVLVAQVEKANQAISDLQVQIKKISLGADTTVKEKISAYREAFVAFVRKGDASALRAVDPQGALSVGTDSAGGFTVPDEFEKMLIQGLLNQNVMRSLATVTPSISGIKSIPVVSAHGSAGWITEAGAFAESDETFSVVTLDAFKVGRLIKVSQELLQDSAFDIEAYLAGEFARSIAAAEETAFVVGTGTGQPTGIVASAGTGKTGAAGQTTSVIADDLIDLYHSLGRPYRNEATWMMADSTAKAVRKLKDTTNQYLWQPGLVAGRPDTLLGRPVEISDNVAAMAANAKSIVFAAFKYYMISDRIGFQLQRLNELYAVNGQVGFRGYKRTDGKLTLAETAKLYINSAT